MAKKIIGQVKLQIPEGQAKPSPPVGPALGQRGVNIMEFCKSFNAATQSNQGMIIPVIITVYADRSFTFTTKTPPASVLLKKAAGLEKGLTLASNFFALVVTLSPVRRKEAKSHRLFFLSEVALAETVTVEIA